MSRLRSNREETNANGGTKWRQILKNLKNHKKFVLRPSQKIYSGNIIAWCVYSDERIKKNTLCAL